jgi:hypothetical protein
MATSIQKSSFVHQDLESILFSELGTDKRVKASFWPWLSSKSPEDVSGRGASREKMLKGHLPRVIHHQA